jgi:peptidoglycan lytic transglycosylase
VKIGSMTRAFSTLAVLATLAGCTLVGFEPETPAPAGDTPGDVTGDRDPSEPFADVADAVPRPEVKSRFGNPETYEVNGKRYRVLETSRGYDEEGVASWYGEPFHGRRASSGETFDMYAMTAAHRSLPLPTYVEVTNLENDRRVVLRVNDRGPFHEDRIIDVSYVAAVKLGMVGTGTARVRVRALDPPARDAPNR